MHNRLIISILCLAFVIGLAFDSVAAPGGSGVGEALTFNLVTTSPFVRSCAPIPAEMLLSLKGRKLLAGSLELEFYDLATPPFRLRTGEITLSEGQTRRKIMLPPMVQNNPGTSNVKARFISGEKTYELGSVALILPPTGQINLCIAYVAPGPITQVGISESAKKLQPENFIPDMSKEDSSNEKGDASAPAAVAASYRYDYQAVRQVGLKSSVVNVAADLLPSTPEGYCAYDILLLKEEGFAMMNEKQLDAFAKWLLGGGAALISPGKAAFEQRHLDFFTRIFRESERPNPVKGLSSEGRLLLDDFEYGAGNFAPGLGRLVLYTGKLDGSEDLKSYEWRRIAAFLWRLKAQRQTAFLAGGHFIGKDEIARELTPRNMPVNNCIVPASLMSGLTQDYYQETYGAGGFELFVDRKIQFVPLWLIALILLVFAMLIGPLDYVVLGWFKARKYTWLVFPCVCVLTAWLMKAMSDAYLGRSDNAKSLIFNDIGPGGGLLRSARIDFLFAGRSKIVKTRHANEVLSPDHRRQYSRYGTVLDEAKSEFYEGTLFSGYEFSRKVVQWTPSMMASFSFCAPPADKGRKWSFPAEYSENVLVAIRDSVADALGRKQWQGCVIMMRGDSRNVLYENCDQNIVWAIGGDKSRYQTDNGFYSLNPKMNYPVLENLSPSIPSSALESQNPRYHFDPTDKDQRLVIVAICEGKDVMVYRRLYRE